jgi:hypothetical protein
MSKMRCLKIRQLLLIAFVFCTSFLVPCGPANSQAAPESIAAQVVAQIKARMPEWLKQRDTPGAAGAVVDDKAVLWRGAYGRTSLPGLFFTFDGEALDLRGTIATFRNIPLIRTQR